MGVVQTILSSSRQTRNVSTLTGDELAQLIVDIMTLPQTKGENNHPFDGKPGLRPGEAKNLLKLFFTIGIERYGSMFNQVVAKSYMNSLPL